MKPVDFRGLLEDVAISPYGVLDWAQPWRILGTFASRAGQHIDGLPGKESFGARLGGTFFSLLINLSLYIFMWVGSSLLYRLPWFTVGAWIRLFTGIGGRKGLANNIWLASAMTFQFVYIYFAYPLQWFFGPLSWHDLGYYLGIV